MNNLIKLLIGKKHVQPLTFTAVQANSTVKLNVVGSLTLSTIKYNVGSGWLPYTINTTITLTNIGDKVQFKNTINSLSTDTSNYAFFEMTGEIAGSGNVQSLLNFSKNTFAYCFVYLFYNCSSLVTAPELPAKTLAANCYQAMFRGCTSLEAAPELPASILTYACYYEMFRGCTSLEAAPELTATTLADSCYIGMFGYCSSLVTAPELPVTTLAPKCYWGMFSFCTALTKAPVLPATTLVANCYYYMFNGCNHLTELNVGFTEWNDSIHATDNWVNGVSASGTFMKPPELTEEHSSSRIPIGWNVASYIDVKK